MEIDQEKKIINKLASLCQVKPSQDFIARVENNLVNYLPSLSPVQPQKTPMFAFRAAILTLVFVFLISAGTVYASQNSLPGQFLYPVKKTLEAVRIRLASDPDKTNLQIQLIDKRLGEIQKLSERQAIDLEKAAAEYEKAVSTALENAKNSAVNKEELLNKLEEKFNQHAQVLEEVAQQAPSQAQDALDKALEASQKGAAAAKEALEKESSNSAPAQTPSGSQSDQQGKEKLPNDINPSGRR